MKTARRVGVMIMLLPWLFLCTGCFGIPISLPTPTPTPFGTRTITASTLPLHEYWRVPFNCIGAAPYYPPALIALAGRVICLDYQEGDDGLPGLPQLKVLEAATGQILWQVSKDPGSSDVFADSERVYFVNHYTLRVYDLTTGRPLWDAALPERHSYLMHPADETLIVWTDTMEKTLWYYFDIHTGSRLATTDAHPKETANMWLGQFPQFTLYSASRAPDLWAVANDSNTVLWHIQAPYPIYNPGLLYKDSILLAGSDNGLIVLEAQTGKTLWANGTAEIPFPVSNFLLLGDAVYALEPDARLVQRELVTGREVGYVQFAPMATDHHSLRYYIASDGQMLFVSFGDSQELIALGP